MICVSAPRNPLGAFLFDACDGRKARAEFPGPAIVGGSLTPVDGGGLGLLSQLYISSKHL